MANLKVVLPSDEAILGYDLEALIKNVEQHAKNIVTFQQAIADEQARLAVAQSIVERKKELESGNSGVQQD